MIFLVRDAPKEFFQQILRKYKGKGKEQNAGKMDDMKLKLGSL